MTKRIEYADVLAASLNDRCQPVLPGETHFAPDTAEEMEAAQKRFAALLNLFNLPEFAPLRLQLGFLAEDMMQDGFLTESDYMVIAALAHIIPAQAT